jgi:D-glycero-beta-D-manno-heptose 1-phosphate adenylyltransferase
MQTPFSCVTSSSAFPPETILPTLSGRKHECFQAYFPQRAVTLSSVALLATRAEILEQRARWKDEGKTVVFTNGCYDLLHPGHIRLLEKARSEGDVLIVGLNSDVSVSQAKGQGRPLTPELERAEVLLSLEAVDRVVLFDEDTPRALIADLLPDVLVKGADWAHFIAGREEVEAAGGRVLTVTLEPGYSTTGIIEKVLSQQP